ncbi:MAG: hypothetical protein NTV04_20455 [Deltaproteobacteria bacterium]|nr:hypothetical protein [Deltaproteobacteria bacterium]
MSDSTLVMGTIYAPLRASVETAFAHYCYAESAFAKNTTQEIVIEQSSLSKEVMLASEKSLMTLWMNPEEEEAWKDL